MAVKVTEDGRTISLVVARQMVNGREFPIRKSVVAVEGAVYPDDEVGDHVVQYAKNDERGLTYVSDSELESNEKGTSSSSSESSAEPFEGYDELSSAEAGERYETEQDPAVKKAILDYELAKPGRKRGWVEKAQAGDSEGGVEVS